MKNNQQVIQENYEQSTGRKGIFEITQMSHLISKRMDKELARLSFPLQMDQLPTLFIVYLSGNTLLSQQEIADNLHRDKSGIQRAIRVLERDGYIRIEADKEDRRKNLIRMTPPGKIVIEQAIRITTELNQRLISVLSPAEQEALDSITNKLTEALTGPIS